MHRDGRPVGLFQTYEPAADPVGECYDVRPGRTRGAGPHACPPEFSVGSGGVGARRAGRRQGPAR
ncbi:GNAT family N-acetyltransferase [Micromonospora echinospora]|uniref:GNAT family N-acetyltransferase n=1 Tax=Micromonospora echinospora TaxID=1877 RepID=UPI003F4D0A59